MKKLLFLLLLPLLGLGCQADFGTNSKLKAPKEKIVSYRIINQQELFLGGTSTPRVEPVQEELVEYNYVSEQISSRTPYFGKGANVSNAEVLPRTPDGSQPIAFYSEPQFYKGENAVYDVRSATATLSEFENLTLPTISERIRSIFLETAYATTSFTSNSSYTPDGTGTVNVTIVAGGGGGGWNYGGGGGAGGYRTSSTYPVVSGTPYPISVGAGGAGGTTGSRPGVRGASSSFDVVTSTGGGGGGTRHNGGGAGGIADGQPGGSGGGGGGNGSAVPGGDASPSTTPTQGFNGGIGSDGTTGDGGGGGGATEGGQAFAGGNWGGRGGAGVSTTVSGASVGYAGGGGGGANGVEAASSTHGGGFGGIASGAGANAIANTGGGGGGGGGGGSGGAGGAGAGGIVIISFNSSSPAGEITNPIEDVYID